MAALDFPSSPTVGQTYTANGSTWTWDGTSWNASNSAGGLDAGTIVNFASNGAQTGYLLCDGTPATKTLYPALTGKLQDYIKINATTTTAGGVYAQANIPFNGTVMCATINFSQNGTTALTSSDGITWTPRTLPTSSKWTGVAWNGSVFAAVSGYSTAGTVAATSPDGITWTAQTLPTSSYWVGIWAKGSTFCAISGLASTNAAATSTDGVTWTAQTLPVSGTWSTIGATNSLFVTSISGSTTYATSPDGATWTSRTLPVPNYTNFCWNGTYLVYGSTTDNNFLQISTDGINWTKSAKLPFTLTSSNSSIAWNGSLWMVTSTTGYATSPDLQNWTVRNPVYSTTNVVTSNNSIFAFLPSGTNATTASYSSLPDTTKFEIPNSVQNSSYAFIKAT